MCSVFSFSEVGGHRVNEDALVVRPHPADPSCWLCLLADGQGGQPGGARAAQLACLTASERAAGVPVRTLSDAAAWLSILRSADERVHADAQAGYTTLVGFAIGGRRLAGASCGDSAAWLADAAGQVHDLSAAQAKNPPVGSGVARFLPFTASLPEDWLVLAMSDGVWKYVGFERLAELVRTHRGQDLLEALQAQARLPGSGAFQDDFTAVVLQAQAARR
jgi:serine/threonine protein phosphatase PrpC